MNEEWEMKVRVAFAVIMWGVICFLIIRDTL